MTPRKGDGRPFFNSFRFIDASLATEASTVLRDGVDGEDDDPCWPMKQASRRGARTCTSAGPGELYCVPRFELSKRCVTNRTVSLSR